MKGSDRNKKCPCGSGKKWKKCCDGKFTSCNEKTGNFFNTKGKNAEKILHDLALKTFLTDWSYPNPKLSSGKELCDLLVVFDNVAIIFQVKNPKLQEDGKYRQKEVEKNIKQLIGARRQLFELKSEIELENPRRIREKFNPDNINEIYLISVLLGDEEDYASFYERIKDHNVHVFTRRFTDIIMNELDTISDFVEYLRKKEVFLKKEQEIIITGGEEELLAIYLMNNKDFSRLKEASMISIEEGSWAHYINLPEYKLKKEANKISYGWDSIINRAHEGSEKYEFVARELARPNRFERRYLSKVYFEGHVAAHEADKDLLFRRILPMSGVTYCFLFQDIEDNEESREKRKLMLHAICYIARGKFKQNSKVIGIASEKEIRPTCSYDFLRLEMPTWTKKNDDELADFQKETKIFTQPIIGHTHEQEYPDPKQAKN